MSPFGKQAIRLVLNVFFLQHLLWQVGRHDDFIPQQVPRCPVVPYSLVLRENSREVPSFFPKG